VLLLLLLARVRVSWQLSAPLGSTCSTCSCMVTGGGEMERR
jgi:hypothetical protein